MAIDIIQPDPHDPNNFEIRLDGNLIGSMSKQLGMHPARPDNVRFVVRNMVGDVAILPNNKKVVAEWLARTYAESEALDGVG